MRIYTFIVFLVFLSACASPVNVDYDRSYNFASAVKYRVQQKPVRVSADTRVNTSFMQQRVINEIKQALNSKGYIYDEKNAGVTIKYYLDIKQEVEVQDSSVSFGFGSAGHHSAIGFGLSVPVGESYSIDNLVLTLDVYANKKNNLVWRGSLARSLYEGATPDSYNRLIKELVTDIFSRFPPG